MRTSEKETKLKLTDSDPAAVTNSCKARTDNACSITNTHCDKSGGIFLSAIFSRKQWRLPNPSAANITRSPVAVHDRHTISSCLRTQSRRRSPSAVPATITKHKQITKFSNSSTMVYFAMREQCIFCECIVVELPFARMKHHPARSLLQLQPWLKAE